MTLTRRDLLRWLLAAPIAATVDVEQLLWVPKPIITVPAMPTDITRSDILYGVSFAPNSVGYLVYGEDWLDNVDRAFIRAAQRRFNAIQSQYMDILVRVHEEFVGGD